MLPWEHLAVGYCSYSLVYRLVTGRAPDGRAAIAVAVGAALPDLIDKPLAWQFGVLPGGRSLGHSVLFALPTTLLVATLLGGVAGSAFGVGVGTHLVGDVYYPVVFGREPVTGFLLYPLTEAPPSDAVGFLTRTREISDHLGTFLATSQGRLYVAAEVALLGGATLLWLLDGAPGLRPWRVRWRRGPAGER